MTDTTPLSKKAPSEREVVGFENMPLVNYETAYPQTTNQFLRRLAITMTRTPLAVAAASILLQRYVMCVYEYEGAADSSSSWPDGSLRSLLFGTVEGKATSGRLSTSFFGELSPAWQFGLFVSIARMATALICHTFYTLLEKNNWLSHYKIPRPPQIVPDAALRADNIKSYIVEFLTGPLTMWALIQTNIIYEIQDSCAAPIALLPTALFIAGCFFINETGFYWCHRLLHEIPFLYRTVHKKHHKYIGSISIAAEYAHPAESFFSAALPLIFLILFVPVNPIVFAVWVTTRLLETFESHSGYCFDGSFLSEKLNLTHSGYTLFHDFHHVANKGNYGQGGIFWDYVCDTDKLFRTKMAAAGERKKGNIGKQK